MDFSLLPPPGKNTTIEFINKTDIQILLQTWCSCKDFGCSNIDKCNNKEHRILNTIEPRQTYTSTNSIHGDWSVRYSNNSWKGGFTLYFGHFVKFCRIPDPIYYTMDISDYTYVRMHMNTECIIVRESEDVFSLQYK